MGKRIHTKQEKKMQLSHKSIIRVKNKPRVIIFETKLLMSLRCKGVSVKVYDK